MVLHLPSREWTLYTLVIGIGRITCNGTVENGEVVFTHDAADDGGIVLRVSVSRASEISKWNASKSSRMNMRIVHRPTLIDKTVWEDECACGAVICFFQVGTDVADVIHSIPYCQAFKERGLAMYPAHYRVKP